MCVQIDKLSVALDRKLKASSKITHFKGSEETTYKCGIIHEK